MERSCQVSVVPGLIFTSSIRFHPRHDFFSGLPDRSPTLPFIIPRMNNKQRFMKPVEILAPNDQFIPGVAQSVKLQTLTIQDSLQITAAEYWLELGEADQALKELEILPSRSWIHRWAIKTRIAAMGVLRGREEVTA